MQVTSDGNLVWQGRVMRCALGHGGVAPALRKREGDGATPAGVWPLRRLLYRADRLDLPPTQLDVQPIRPQDGWCDAPDDPLYNQFVRHPYPASAEHLWRDDHVYDLIVPLGYNDDPVIAGKGSAIFLHLARSDYAPTQGCVALALDDMLFVLRTITPDTLLRVADAVP